MQDESKTTKPDQQRAKELADMVYHHMKSQTIPHYEDYVKSLVNAFEEVRGDARN